MSHVPAFVVYILLILLVWFGFGFCFILFWEVAQQKQHNTNALNE